MFSKCRIEKMDRKYQTIRFRQIIVRRKMKETKQKVKIINETRNFLVPNLWISRVIIQVSGEQRFYKTGPQSWK